MKRIISIGLILLMSVQSFYQLGLITYFQFNRQYISEVLCVNKEKPMTMCYGSCFLKKNLNLDDQAKNSRVPNGKEKIEIPVFLVSESHYSFCTISSLSIKNTPYRFNLSSVSPEAPFHPPSVG